MFPAPETIEHARLKSYTWHALATLLLYLFFFIPGVIANIMFCQEAARMERIAGGRLPGAGLLRFMLGLVAAIPLLILVLILLAVVSGGLGSAASQTGDSRAVLLAVIVWGLGLGGYLASRSERQVPTRLISKGRGPAHLPKRIQP